MKTAWSSDQVINMVRDYIRAVPHDDYGLLVDERAVWQEDDWWHVVVKPDRPRVRIYDYAERLTTIEEQIQEKYDIKVLLVPALAED